MTFVFILNHSTINQQYVLLGDYCEGVTTLTYKPHPFYCNSAVACNDKSIGVNVCGMDECADTQDDTTYKCSSCESVTDSCRAKGILFKHDSTKIFS